MSNDTLEKMAREDSAIKWVTENGVPHTERDMPAWHYDAIAYQAGHKAGFSASEARNTKIWQDHNAKTVEERKELRSQLSSANSRAEEAERRCGEMEKQLAESSLRIAEAELRCQEQYTVMQKEIADLRNLLDSVSKRVIPGEVDSTDAMLSIVGEREAQRKEIDRLRAALWAGFTMQNGRAYIRSANGAPMDMNKKRELIVRQALMSGALSATASEKRGENDRSLQDH